MDFEIGKGGNPFLTETSSNYTTEDTMASGADGQLGIGISSNPFLSNSDFNIPASSENPFMSFSSTETNQFISGSNYTNPFAQYDFSETASGADGNTDAMDTGATIDFFGISETDTSSTNIFATSDTAPQNIFNDFTESKPSADIKQSDDFDLMNGAKNGVHTEGDFCRETSDLFDTSATVAEETASNTPKSGPPRRPPPPRPEPPSKETKDLILSVTGAMEATSSHLLDRLQATRTPSPTPMRDLHSPSPTPDVMFPDLLEVGGIDMPMGQIPSNEQNDLKLLSEESAAKAPPRPPPRPVPPIQKSPEVQQDIMDIFNMDTPATAPTTTATTQEDSNLLVMLDTSAEPRDDLLMGDIPVTTNQQDINLFDSTTMELESSSGIIQQQTDTLMSTEMLEATEAPLIKTGDDFDAFAAKFESAAKEETQDIRVVEEDPFDPFTSIVTSGALTSGDDG